MKSKHSPPPLASTGSAIDSTCIAARLGNYIAADSMAPATDLTMPAWRSLAVIARHQPLTATQLGALYVFGSLQGCPPSNCLYAAGLIRRGVDGADKIAAPASVSRAKAEGIQGDRGSFPSGSNRRSPLDLSATELTKLRRLLDEAGPPHRGSGEESELEGILRRLKPSEAKAVSEYRFCSSCSCRLLTKLHERRSPPVNSGSSRSLISGCQTRSPIRQATAPSISGSHRSIRPSPPICWAR